MKEITLKTLSKATAQEVFDQVATHLLTQNARSVTVERPEACMYKNPEELKCAAGCLISDDEYRDDFEGHDWSDLINEFDLPDAHHELILELQSIHDTCLEGAWLYQLRDLALRKKLDTKVLDFDQESKA